MKLPHWVEEDIKALPSNFTGQIVIECWSGGVTNRKISDTRQAPKANAQVKIGGTD